MTIYKVISVEFGYDCRSVLENVFKAYDIFCVACESRKRSRVFGLIHKKQIMRETLTYRVNRPLSIRR